jgi:NTF2 fold immunity protein
MRKLKPLIALTAIVVLGAAAVARSQSNETYVPPNGFVPDATTASRIAEAVWLPIYGETKIAAEKPFKVVLNGDVWTVTGKDLAPGSFGGVALADISKRDGRVLRVTHGK